MSARWESTPAERRAVLESRHPATTLLLVILLLTLVAMLGSALVAG